MTKPLHKVQTYSFLNVSSAEDKIRQYVNANKITLRPSHLIPTNDPMEQFYLTVKNKDALNFWLIMLAGKDFLQAASAQPNVKIAKLQNLILGQFSFRELTVERFKVLSERFNANFAQLKDAVSKNNEKELEDILKDLVNSRKLSYDTVKKGEHGSKSVRTGQQIQALAQLTVFEQQNHFIIAVFKRAASLKKKEQQPKKGKPLETSNPLIFTILLFVLLILIGLMAITSIVDLKEQCQQFPDSELTCFLAVPYQHLTHLIKGGNMSEILIANINISKQ